MVFRLDWVGLMQRDMERLLEDLSRRKPPSYQFYPTPWQPPVDIHETADEIIVLAELAGVSREDLEILADASSLVLRGEKEETNPTKQSCHQLEIYWGPFERTIPLPTTVDPDRTSATFQDGILKVVLPKSSTEKSLRIKIRS